MKFCKLDIKKATVNTVLQQAIYEAIVSKTTGRYKYEIIDDNYTIKITGERSTNPKSPYKIADELVSRINSYKPDILRVVKTREDDQSPILLEVYVNPDYINQKFDSLPEEQKNNINVDLSRDINFFNGDGSLMEQERKWDSDEDPIRYSTNISNNQSLKEGLQWLKQIMPDVEPVLVDGLIDNIANGSYNILKDLITLSKDFADKGTVKHETLHKVFNLLPKSEQEKLLNEGSKKYGIERGESTATIKYSQADQNKVDFGLKAIEILQSDKAKEIFKKGQKSGWDLNKILNELQVPKEQKQLILDLGKTNREEIITNLLANYSYAIEINTAKENHTDEGKDSEEHNNLNVPGGTNYKINVFKTPLIIPSIINHFFHKNQIGWFRSDDKENKIVGWKEEDDFLNSETAQYNPITKDDKIIWGHPAIGKSYAAKKVKMIDFDSYKIGINRKYNLYVAPGLSDTELRTDDKTREARENWRYENEENQALWNQFIRDAWQQAKQDAKQQGAILFASDLLVLREFGNEVDKALTMPDELFFQRSKQRNNYIEGPSGTKVWKGNLNKAVANFKEKFGRDKVINTDKYLSDLLEGNPKTRRILEVQSDLFQKGRDEENLVDNSNQQRDGVGSIPYSTTGRYAGLLDKIRQAANENMNNSPKEGTIVQVDDNSYIKKNGMWYPYTKDNQSENQFLQLLNKDNNWVTFFIKSIIADSAKKGYEKVLFPTSEVVSKIQKFDEAAEKYSNAISKLEKDRTGEDNFIISEWEKDSTKKTIKGTLDFYNNLRNTLDDLVGGNKNDREKGIYKLPQITDEYGNTWNEITITPKMSETIRLNTPNGKVEYTGDLAIEEKIAEEAYNSKDEKVPTTLIGKFIQSIRNMLRNLYKEKDNISRLIRDLNQGRFKEKFGEIPSVSLENEELSYFDEVGDYKVKYQQNNKEGIIASEKTIRDLAARISDRIGIPYKIESDRTKQYKGKIENGTAYINLAYATLDTVPHEVLAHPIIRALRNKSKKSIDSEIDKMIEMGIIKKQC
jgi:hypothetical protein